MKIRITADGRVECPNCHEMQKSMKPHLTSESKRASNKCSRPNLIDIPKFLKELTAYKDRERNRERMRERMTVTRKRKIDDGGHEKLKKENRKHQSDHVKRMKDTGNEEKQKEQQRKRKKH